MILLFFFFFEAEDGIRDGHVTGVQTGALPISANPTISAGRAPKIIRARMSRPRWSVPKRWARPAASCDPGALSRFVMSCSVGSYPAIHDAPNAATITIITTTRPKRAVRRRARRRANRAHSRGAGARPAARSTARLSGTLIGAGSVRPARTGLGLRHARPGSAPADNPFGLSPADNPFGSVPAGSWGGVIEAESAGRGRCRARQRPD